MVEHEMQFSPDQFAVTFYPVLFGIIQEHGKLKYNGNKYVKSFYCDQVKDVRGYSDISFEIEDNGHVRAPIRISVSREAEGNHFYIRELTITETKIESLAVRRQTVIGQVISPKFRYSGKFDPSHLNVDVLANWIEEAETHIDSGQTDAACDDPKLRRMIILDRKLKERLKNLTPAKKEKRE